MHTVYLNVKHNKLVIAVHEYRGGRNRPTFYWLQNSYEPISDNRTLMNLRFMSMHSSREQAIEYYPEYTL